MLAGGWGGPVAHSFLVLLEIVAGGSDWESLGTEIKKNSAYDETIT